MTIFLSLAVRNLLRNKKRSLITLSAITFGLGALIFLRGFIYGAQRQMVDNITTTLTSDAQIVPDSLENIYNTNGAIEDPEKIRQILKNDHRITAFAERVIAGGIVSSATNSMATFIVGIDPDQEGAIGSRRNAVKGRYMTRDDEHGAGLGEKMRKILGLEIGDKVIVTAQDYYGALAGEAYTLVGTFETGNDQIDNGTVMLLKTTAQRLISFDQKISKFALKINRHRDIGRVVEDLKMKIGTGLKILTWEDLIPMMAQLMRFQNGMLFIVILIVLTVVAVGILNTLMMSIIERIREFGLMMALGTKPSQVVFLITLESFLLTLMGSVLGMALGISLILYFGRHGIDLSRFVSAFSNFLIGSHVYPRVDWSYLALSLGVVFISNVIVSLYPAWRAGKLEPIEAMRQAG